MKAKIYCESLEDLDSGRYHLSIKDINGKQISGKSNKKINYLEANILEDFGDKALILLPKGLNKETAIINSKRILN